MNLLQTLLFYMLKYVLTLFLHAFNWFVSTERAFQNGCDPALWSINFRYQFEQTMLKMLRTLQELTTNISLIVSGFACWMSCGNSLLRFCSILNISAYILCASLLFPNVTDKEQGCLCRNPTIMYCIEWL
jgi:hypothetical protein